MKRIHLVLAGSALLFLFAGCYTAVNYAPRAAVASAPHGMGCGDCHMDPGYGYHYPGTYSYYYPVSFSFGWSWGWGSGYPYWGSCYYNPWWYCGWGWGSCYPCYYPTPYNCGGGYCPVPRGNSRYYDARTRPGARDGNTVISRRDGSRSRYARSRYAGDRTGTRADIRDRSGRMSRISGSAHAGSAPGRATRRSGGYRGGTSSRRSGGYRRPASSGHSSGGTRSSGGGSNSSGGGSGSSTRRR
jgi:hypothetical protein